MAHITKRMKLAFGALAILAICGGGVTLDVPIGAAQSAGAQQAAPPAPASHDDMAGMDMSGTGDKSSASVPAAAAKSATDAMSNMPGMAHDSHGDMDEMAGHMYMTTLRPANAADQKRAAEIVTDLKPALEKYRDYHVALNEGFHIFLPNFPQPTYHFTSTPNAIAAQFKFDAARPTSLLYKKVGDGYELVGAMYTAPKKYTEDQLNERVPLSVAEWHRHINFCLPTMHASPDALAAHQFRSITTEQACDAAGGRWFPQIFGWMVHVYPYESDPAKIWAH
jgi:hypothetical protein